MTMEEFVLLIDDNFSDFRDNYYPSFIKTKIKKSEFKKLSAYRWALDDLINYVSEDIPNDYQSYPITRFIDSVVGYEYEKDVFSKVNDRWRTFFECARTVAEQVEDILNAMI